MTASGQVAAGQPVGPAGLGEAVAQRTVDRLRAAPKYRQVHIDTITDVVGHEAAYASNESDLERRARLTLHKVMAGYLFTARPTRLLRGMDEAVAAGPQALREWCLGVLARHFSTAERLADLDLLYPAIMDLTGPVTSIADLACALNPFTVPWLRAVTDASYTGYDLNLSYVECGAAFLDRTDQAAGTAHRDVLIRPAEISADLALLLKTYHCIENRQPDAGLRLVRDVGARQVLVSFPTRTMSGRTASFTGGHIQRLTELAQQRRWPLRRASLAGEELIVVVKGDAGDSGT